MRTTCNGFTSSTCSRHSIVGRSRHAPWSCWTSSQPSAPPRGCRTWQPPAGQRGRILWWQAPRGVNRSLCSRPDRLSAAFQRAHIAQRPAHCSCSDQQDNLPHCCPRCGRHTGTTRAGDSDCCSGKTAKRGAVAVAARRCQRQQQHRQHFPTVLAAAVFSPFASVSIPQFTTLPVHELLSCELPPQSTARFGALLQSVGLDLPSWQAAGSSLHEWLHSEVLSASVSASLKLILICGFVGWRLHTDRLAPDTAPVLSEVAFSLLIPSMLFSKVAATLSQQPDPTLFAIPLAASLQVLAGALLGRLAARVVEGSYSRSRTIFGWHPLNPAKSAAAIAATTAAATGVPSAAEALLQRPKNAPQGTRQLVLAACAFGNSLTLPLVFLTSLLPAAAADRAAGYTALFLMGWSPLLWSLGYQLLAGVGGPASRLRRPTTAMGTADDVGAARRSLASNVGLGKGHSFGTLAVAVSEGCRQAVRAAKTFADRVINPPLVGVICGVLVGVTPLGSILFQPTSATTVAATAHLPMELNMAFAVLRNLADVLSLLGSATLAVQAVVLGASMFPRPVRKLAGATELERYRAEEAAEEAQHLPVSSPAAVLSLPMLILRFFVPKDAVDRRVLGAVGLVRCVCMPLVTLGIVSGLNRLGWMPTDPVCQLAILVQGAMPSAQNLVLLMQLRPETQPLAPKFAKLLLRLYTLAVLPLTLWMAVFAARMPVALRLIT